MRTPLLLAAWTAALGTLAVAAPAPAVTDEEVGQAIDKLRAEIYQKQDAQSGSWEKTGMAPYPGAQTAMCTLALLISGESAQRPEIAKAIAYLRGPEVKPQWTYQASLLVHVWARLPDAYLKDLRQDAAWLQAAALEDTTFTYTSPRAAPAVRFGGFLSVMAGDHSNTQYGLLGLWEAAKRGERNTSGDFWDRVIRHWVQAQNTDGGWSYLYDARFSNMASTGSMTAAGLTALLVAQQEAARQQPRPEAQKAIDRGLDWMDKHFRADANPIASQPNAPMAWTDDTWLCYYLYGVERVGLASGWKDFNGQDWFQSGAQTILKSMPAQDDNDPAKPANRIYSLAADCFKLMFLSRGRVPVWITKLKVPGLHWNNRPNDIYFLNQFISSYREGEVNWQVLDLGKTTAEELRTTPILYLASEQAVELTPPQRAVLKRYLDLGGMLLANPDNGSEVFRQSILKLGQSLYPHLEFRRLPPEHLLFNAQHNVETAPEEAVWGLSNGCRELILLPSKDWGRGFQADEMIHRSPPWKLAANLFVLATDRGVLENRLVERFEAPTKKPGGTVNMGRARYKGNWLPEPLAVEPLATCLLNRAGLQLVVSGATDPPPAAADRSVPPASPTAGTAAAVLDLDAIGSCDYKLVHLACTDALTLSEGQKAAIKAYTRRGGTLLIENVGGTGRHTLDLERQLEDVFDGLARPLDEVAPDHPLLTGADLPGGYDIRHVTYRRFTLWQSEHTGHRPLLMAFFLGERPAVILSHQDLSLGLLDVRQWGINGYVPESARQVMTNLVLWADQQQLVPPGQIAPVPAVRLIHRSPQDDPAAATQPAGASTQPAPSAARPRHDPA